MIDSFGFALVVFWTAVVFAIVGTFGLAFMLVL